MIPNNSLGSRGWLKIKNKPKTWKHNKLQKRINKIVVEVQVVEIGVESQGPNVQQSLHSLTNLISLAQLMVENILS